MSSAYPASCSSPRWALHGPAEPGGGVAWYYMPTPASVLGSFVTSVLTTPLGLLALQPAARAVFQPQEAPSHYVEGARAPLVLRPRTFRANAEDVAGLPRLRHGPEPPLRRDPRAHGDRLRRRRPDRASGPPFARAGAGDPGLVLLPGVGHMLHFAAPDRIVAEIDALASAMAAAR
jgi:hypothetical protein